MAKQLTEEKLQKFFEDNGFNVSLSKEGKVQCAEIEKWTDGGVDMIFYLRPFSVKAFKECVDGFDMDEEIDLHRQDQRYKNAFTIAESVKDFTKFEKGLKKLMGKLFTLEAHQY